jgi:hypothetical protein
VEALNRQHLVTLRRLVMSTTISLESFAPPFLMPFFAEVASGTNGRLACSFGTQTFQSVRPAGLKPAELIKTADNMSAGRTGRMPVFRYAKSEFESARFFPFI